MGSDASHFNVSLTVRDKSHNTVPTNHNLFVLTSLTPYRWAKPAHTHAVMFKATGSLPGAFLSLEVKPAKFGVLRIDISSSNRRLLPVAPCPLGLGRLLAISY